MCGVLFSDHLPYVRFEANTPFLCHVQNIDFDYAQGFTLVTHWCCPLRPLQPLWRNFFENTATVQASHRVLAMTTLMACFGTFVMARGSHAGAMWHMLPTSAQYAQKATGIVAIWQARRTLSCISVRLGLPLHSTRGRVQNASVHSSWHAAATRGPRGICCRPARSTRGRQLELSPFGMQEYALLNYCTIKIATPWCL